MKLTKQQKNILQLMRDYQDRGPLTYQFMDNCITVSKKNFAGLLDGGFIFRRDWDSNRPALYSLTELGKSIGIN